MFSERTEESSAVQYFQVGTRHPPSQAVTTGWPLGGRAVQGGPTRVLVPALPLAGHVTLGRCPSLAGPQFPHL